MSVPGYVRMSFSFRLQRMGDLIIYSLGLISIHICQVSFSTRHMSIDTQDRRSPLCCQPWHHRRGVRKSIAVVYRAGWDHGPPTTISQRAGDDTPI